MDDPVLNAYVICVWSIRRNRCDFVKKEPNKKRLLIKRRHIHVSISIEISANFSIRLGLHHHHWHPLFHRMELVLPKVAVQSHPAHWYVYRFLRKNCWRLLHGPKKQRCQLLMFLKSRLVLWTPLGEQTTFYMSTVQSTVKPSRWPLLPTALPLGKTTLKIKGKHRIFR